MLDYKDIITKHYALGLSGTKIAEMLGASKSGVNDFLKAFRECPALNYPLPDGIPITVLRHWYTETEPSSAVGIRAMSFRTMRPWRRKCPPERT